MSPIFCLPLYFYSIHSSPVSIRPAPPSHLQQIRKNNRARGRRKERVRRRRVSCGLVNGSAQIGTNEQEKKKKSLHVFFSLSLSVCRWHSNFLFKTKSLRSVTFFYQVSSSSIKNSMHSHTLSISFQMCCSWIPSSFYYGFANTLACSRALHLNVWTSVCNVSAK